VTGVNDYTPPLSPTGTGAAVKAKLLGWRRNDRAVSGTGFAKVGLPNGKVRTVAVLFIDFEELGCILHEPPEEWLPEEHCFGWLNWRDDDTDVDDRELAEVLPGVVKMVAEHDPLVAKGPYTCVACALPPIVTMPPIDEKNMTDEWSPMGA
jgi:hypothetical protein